MLFLFSQEFLSKYNRSRINSAFRKGCKWYITDLSFNTQELIEDSYDLSKKVQNRTHCLSSHASLLPPSSPANYKFNLRPHSHDLSLPCVFFFLRLKKTV